MWIGLVLLGFAALAWVVDDLATHNPRLAAALGFGVVVLAGYPWLAVGGGLVIWLGLRMLDASGPAAFAALKVVGGLALVFAIWESGSEGGISLPSLPSVPALPPAVSYAVAAVMIAVALVRRVRSGRPGPAPALQLVDDGDDSEELAA